MKRQYVEINFRSARLALIERVNDILDDAEANGETVNLRQLFYRLVTMNIIQNTQNEYKNLSKLTTDARMAGLMDWDHLEDRHHTTYRFYASDDVEEIKALIDMDQWQEVSEQEERDKARLTWIAENYEDVLSYAENRMNDFE